MWPTSIAVWKMRRAAALGTAVALAGLAEIGEARLVVAPRLDAAQVPAVAVRAGDELAVAQRLVGDDSALERRAGRASLRPRRTWRGSRRRSRDANAPRERRRASSRSAGRRRARARARARRRPSTTGIAFDVAAASMPRSSASASIVVTPGVSTSSGAASALGELGARGTPRARSRCRRRSRRSRSGRACSRRSRSARGSRAELAAHDPALRLDVVRLELAALEDPLVRLAVRSKLVASAGLVPVERVRVLHDELADAEQAAARPGLVAILDEKWYQSCGSSLYELESRARGTSPSPRA